MRITIFKNYVLRHAIIEKLTTWLFSIQLGLNSVKAILQFHRHLKRYDMRTCLNRVLLYKANPRLPTKAKRICKIYVSAPPKNGLCTDFMYRIGLINVKGMYNLISELLALETS
jgi:hypothetical protein